MIDIIKSSFRSSPARREMKELGIAGHRLPLVALGVLVLAAADVAAASIALAGF